MTEWGSGVLEICCPLVAAAQRDEQPLGSAFLLGVTAKPVVSGLQNMCVGVSRAVCVAMRVHEWWPELGCVWVSCGGS